MPKTTFQRAVYTFIGMLLMASTMATFNKYLVYGEFSPELFRQVGIAVLQKGPLAFLLQFFIVQKIAAQQAAKYPTDNRLVYTCIRTGFTVMIMCPIMCAYSNIINALHFGWTFGKFLEAWITKMPVNWIFAFCVQVWLLGPLKNIIFRALFKKQLAQSA